MKMVEVETAELIGPSLDWAVAQIEKPANLICLNSFNGGPRTRGNLPHYSADWSQGGPLIEKYGIKLERAGVAWFAGWQYSNGGFVNKYSMMDGDAEDGSNSPLTAACRAIVAAKLGDVVSVPAELINGGGL